MRCLITGGAGFIGRHLANTLVRRGHAVRVLDDLSSGERETLDPAISFHRGDVRDLPKLWSLLQNVDCVFHLAARVSVSESVLFPREYNEVNVGGTVSLMEAMRATGVKRVVLASSGTVYGEQPRQPVYEEMTPNPLAPYAVSKIAAEYYIFTLGRLYDIETVALRLFNVYGPGQIVSPSHPPVIPQFLRQTLGGGSVVINGNGEQTRDFVFVEDVVEALITASLVKHVDRQIINVGSGQECSINQLVHLVEQTTGKKASVLYNEQESGGISRLVADLGRAKRLLGYLPKTSLLDGIHRTMVEDPQFAPYL